jgi:hypothetical protein
MRTIGRHFIRNQSHQAAESRAVEMDAIVYDVLVTERKCRVKIQGSNTPIVCDIPVGYEQTPFFLKPGQAVRIQRKGGIRGRMEVIGIGQTIPTGISSPSISGGADTLMSGGGVSATPNTPDMVVHVAPATYRIDGVTYVSDVTDVTISAAPAAGQWRYDLIVAGDDGVVHVVTGTASATPVVPDVPVNHVLLRTILVSGGSTSVSQYAIGQTWTAPVATSVGMSITDDELAWAETSTAVRLTVYDQYGNTMATAGAGWYLTLSIMRGNGEVSSVEEGSSTTKVGQHAGSHAYADFTYTREGLTTDSSPLLQGVLEYGSYKYITGSIVLLDASGNPMTGSGEPAEYLPAGEQTITYSGGITIDWSLGATAYLELTGNCTVTLSNTLAGKVYRLILAQKSGGNHLVTSWTGVNKWQGGAAPTLTTTVDREDIITFVRQGSTVRAAAALNFF